MNNHLLVIQRCLLLLLFFPSIFIHILLFISGARCVAFYHTSCNPIAFVFPLYPIHCTLSFLYRSAFIIFCQFKRPLIKEKTPKASVGDIAKELGKAWKIMTPKQKEPYDDKAKLEKKRYEEEKESYLATSVNNDEDDEEDEEEEEED